MNKIDKDDVTSFTGQDTHGRANALDHYQMLATRSAIYPGQGTALGLMYVALKSNGEAGEFAEHVGKAFRDDLFGTMQDFDDGAYEINTLTPERHAAIIKELGDMLWYISAAANEIGVNLSQVATANLEKLASRSQRGKLSGSGDDR